MAGEIEAAGDVLTGGLIARAVEPASASAGHAGSMCLNCGTALRGDFCHACGQPGHIHRSLGAIWHDLAHGVLHFEGKIWRTLPMLAFRPGELTRRYIAGERMRFVSPLALFLFSVFLMFAVVSAIGDPVTVPENARAAAAVQTTEDLAEAREKLARADAERRAAQAAGKETIALDTRIAELRGDIRDLQNITVALGNERLSVNSGRTGWTRLDKGIEKAVANPTLLIYKLQSNAYKFSWALIPLSIPFVWLLFFWRRDLHIYDHAVFVTHSLSFMSLFAVLLIVLGAVGLPSDWFALAPIPVIAHLARHLRGAYRLRRRSAVVRVLLLLVFALLVIMLFVSLLLALGLLG